MVVVPTNNLFIPKIKTHISSTLHHSRKRTEKTRTKRKKKGLNFWPNQTTPENPSKKAKLQKEKNPLEINKEKMNPLGTTYISCRWER
jgi:hypothetical protein